MRACVITPCLCIGTSYNDVQKGVQNMNIQKLILLMIAAPILIGLSADRLGATEVSASNDQENQVHHFNTVMNPIGLKKSFGSLRDDLDYGCKQIPKASGACVLGNDFSDYQYTPPATNSESTQVSITPPEDDQVIPVHSPVGGGSA